ncbi:MAG: FAD binding domain-containing protein [Blastocatellia bacterium]|nr:FAD binding domain-containing protein [Blastocatellia bacterium]
MHKFEYASPTTKEQAVALLGKSWSEAEALAGGTDLLSLMKDYISTPARVVNLKGIKELGGISPTRGGVRIGALATIEDLRDKLKGYDAITQAASGITSPQIRNMGTVGGDLCQRPRCWYYRGGFGVLAQGENGEPLVPNGDNRYHAILGNGGEAKFVHPSSLGPALIALGAKIGVFGPGGARQVEAAKFFVTPKSANDRETVLAPNEIVTEIVVPANLGGTSATYEIRQREALDWPLAAASVVLKLDAGKKVKSAAIVLGHVAPTPWVAAEAAQFLAGKTIDEDVAAEAGKIALANAAPLSRNAYKVQLARVAVKRALLKAAGLM